MKKTCQCGIILTKETYKDHQKGLSKAHNKKMNRKYETLTKRSKKCDCGQMLTPAVYKKHQKGLSITHNRKTDLQKSSFLECSCGVWLNKYHYNKHMNGLNKLHNNRMLWKMKTRCSCGANISLLTYMRHKQGKCEDHNRRIRGKKRKQEKQTITMIKNIILDISKDEKNVPVSKEKVKPTKKTSDLVSIEYGKISLDVNG